MSVSMYTLAENVGQPEHTGRKCRLSSTHWQKICSSPFLPFYTLCVLLYPACSALKVFNSIVGHNFSLGLSCYVDSHTYILFSHVKSNLKSKIPILCQHTCLLSFSLQFLNFVNILAFLRNVHSNFFLSIEKKCGELWSVLNSPPPPPHQKKIMPRSHYTEIHTYIYTETHFHSQWHGLRKSPEHKYGHFPQQS